MRNIFKRKNVTINLPRCESQLEGKRYCFYQDRKFGDVLVLFRKDDFEGVSKLLNLPVKPDTYHKEPVFAVSYSEDGLSVMRGSTVEQLLSTSSLRRLDELEFLAKYSYYRYH